jgi:hypothetical protein
LRFFSVRKHISMRVPCDHSSYRSRYISAQDIPSLKFVVSHFCEK